MLTETLFWGKPATNARDVVDRTPPGNLTKYASFQGGCRYSARYSDQGRNHQYCENPAPSPAVLGEDGDWAQDPLLGGTYRAIFLQVDSTVDRVIK